MNTKVDKSTETVWNGETWDEALIGQLPQPSGAVRSAIFEAAEKQVAGKKPGKILRFGAIRRFVPAMEIAAALFVIGSVAVWYANRNSNHASVVAGNDQTIEQMTEYVTETFDTEELSPFFAVNDAQETDDTIAAGLSFVSESLALLEDDIRYDYFTL